MFLSTPVRDVFFRLNPFILVGLFVFILFYLFYCICCICLFLTPPSFRIAVFPSLVISLTGSGFPDFSCFAKNLTAHSFSLPLFCHFPNSLRWQDFSLGMFAIKGLLSLPPSLDQHLPRTTNGQVSTADSLSHLHQPAVAL